MKGDFTRSTFRPEKHYSGVRMQQGRVQLDADWNEQGDIAAHHREVTALDVIGESGGPGQAAGFAFATAAIDLPNDQQQVAAQFEPLSAGDLFISAGRYYVDGVLCENEHPVTLGRQSDAGGRLPADEGLYLMFLHVWERHISALDDSEILEVALGGPDTATRTKTVWQVEWLRVPDETATCGSDIPEWTNETAKSTGRLTARATPTETTDDPCLLEPGAGYKRLENQLYRVEIHERGPLGSATFKWSRDNGSVVAAWLGQSGNDLTLSSTGRDQTLGFIVGDCVELTDDIHELQGVPGVLVKVTAIVGQTITIDPGANTVDRAQFPVKPKVRRWNMGSSAALPVDVPVGNDGFIELESGVEVKFEPGVYDVGDYWLIPARTATGSVEWRFTEPQPPEGIVHHYCRLGFLAFDGSQYTALQDCRKLFPSVTQLTSLFYVGGDGQVAAPGQTLPQSLEVGVANGQWPVAGATVRFTVTVGTGTLSSGAAIQEVVTGANGIASCAWRLGFGTPGQQVEATLLDSTKAPVHLPVRFNATFSPDAQDGGFQIAKILLTDGTILENDGDFSVDLLAKGIDVVCTANLAPGTANRANCFLALEMPFPLTSGDIDFWGPEQIGFQPIVLAATARVRGVTMSWTPTSAVSAWLQSELFKQLTALNRVSRVLARLTILGNVIWQDGKSEVFLDADAFGMRVASGAIQPTRLRMPSGDGRRGGRLDMWFFIVPQITISISPETVSVRTIPQFSVPVSFTVTVEGTQNREVELSVEGVVGGNATNGTISVTDEALGIWTYRAPTRGSALGRVVTVAATSLADRTRVARASVTLLPPFGPIDVDLPTREELKRKTTTTTTNKKKKKEERG